MNFDKESKSEDFFFGGGGGGGGGEERERERERGVREGDSNRKKKENTKTTGIRLFFVLMLYIKFQVPGSSGSLDLAQTKGVMDW